MKKAISMALMVVSMAPAAFADGFVCEVADEALKVTVYNHTQASAGTRNAAVMVLSDQSVQHGRKTIARFTDVKGTLSNSGASYAANVDLRFADSRRAGEYIAGTRLGQIDEILLDVDFTYGAPVEAGEEMDAELTIVKRNGDKIRLDALCQRYLKN